jgi:CRP/FNR family cyclic AMP-dependent transcriptional regulator
VSLLLQLSREGARSEGLDPERLGSLPLFKSLSRKELGEVAHLADEVSVPAGQRLASEGQFAYEFFVIEEGTAKVTRAGEHVADLGVGDFFGEIGLLESERRVASVEATSPMRLVVMSGRDFRSVERHIPDIAQQVRQAIKERMQAQ